MKKPVIIFGIGKIADVIQYYMREDSQMEVAAFTVDRDFMGDVQTFNGLPVIPFDRIEEEFSPESLNELMAVIDDNQV